MNRDGRITNDLDLNDDGEVTLADWERGAYIVVNSWGDKWSKDGKIYLLYSAMIDPTWKRGNYLGRAEVTRYLPQKTLRLKVECNDRTGLRLTIGIAGSEEATSPEHEFAPQAFNGWPLFGGSNAGHVPMAGPEDDTPLEVGIDLTPLLKNLSPDRTGRSKLFISLGKAEKSKVEGTLHECAVRSYDTDGNFLGESKIEIGEGAFGESPLQLQTVVSWLEPK